MGTSKQAPSRQTPAPSGPAPSAAGPVDFGSNAAMAERLRGADLADDLDLLASTAPLEASARVFSSSSSVGMVTMASAVLRVQSGQLRLGESVAATSPEDGREIQDAALGAVLNPLLQVAAAADVAPNAAVEAIELHSRASSALIGL